MTCIPAFPFTADTFISHIYIITKKYVQPQVQVSFVVVRGGYAVPCPPDNQVWEPLPLLLHPHSPQRRQVALQKSVLRTLKVAPNSLCKVKGELGPTQDILRTGRLQAKVDWPKFSVMSVRTLLQVIKVHCPVGKRFWIKLARFFI